MHAEIGDGLSRFDDFTLGLCVRFLVQGVQEMSSNLLRLVRFSNGLNALAANSRSFHDGLLGLNSGNGSWGRELRGASLDGDTLLLSTEATIGVGSNANCVLLGEALRVLGSSFSLSK